MRLLDLFCGAGGAAMGYSQAGFTEIVGVDIAPQPNYPFEFYQMDVFALRQDRIDGCWHEYAPASSLPGMNPACLGHFDLIHASPPCQAYSTQGRSSRWGSPPSSAALIAPTQALLDETGIPFAIENVPGARHDLREPMVALRGRHFGLGVDRLRYFELGGWWMMSPPPGRRPAGLILGVYGRAPDGRALKTTVAKSRLRAPTSIDEASEAMGIDWMTWDEIREAIPPAYTKFIGDQFLAQMKEER